MRDDALTTGAWAFVFASLSGITAKVIIGVITFAAAGPVPDPDYNSSSGWLYSLMNAIIAATILRIAFRWTAKRVSIVWAAAILGRISAALFLCSLVGAVIGYISWWLCLSIFTYMTVWTWAEHAFKRRLTLYL
jgi:hypothetical protein